MIGVYVIKRKNRQEAGHESPKICISISFAGTKQRTALVVCGVALLCLVGCGTSGTGQGETTSSGVTEQTGEMSNSKQEKMLDLIEEIMLSREELKERDLNKIRKNFTEADFLEVWIGYLRKEMEMIEEDYLAGQGPWGLSLVASRLEREIEVYTVLYGPDSIQPVIDQINRIDSCTEDMYTLKDQYGEALLLADEIREREVYVTQRLGKNYQSSILGVLEKELSTSEQKNSSDWVAYEVDYIMGTAFPGENFVILYADTLDPFTESGVHWVSYYDTGTTTTVTDSKGFNMPAPIMRLVNDPYELEEAANNFVQISDAAMNEWKILVRMVFPERFEVKASPESVTKDGTYQYEYTQFVFEFYDTPDEKYGSNGTFFLSGSGYCGWLYQIDVNTYLYSDNYDSAGVMSFYEEDGKTYMCDYSDSDPTKGYELLATYEYID